MVDNTNDSKSIEEVNEMFPTGFELGTPEFEGKRANHSSAGLLIGIGKFLNIKNVIRKWHFSKN